MENSKARVLMLAVSGVLFGASAFGWWVHSMPPQADTTAAAATTSAVGATREASLGEAARSGAESRPLTMASVPISAPEVYLATTREEAERAARASVRQDPFSGITGGAPSATASIAPVVASHVRESGFVPPPPPIVQDLPKGYERAQQEWGRQPVPPNETPVAVRREKLTNEDVRLVGLIDGKAIFRVNRDAAAELGLPRTFTVGKGESFSNLKIENVEKDSATVRDGTTVATKELGPIQ